MTIRKTSLYLNIALCFGMAVVFCCFMLYAQSANNIEKIITDREICLNLGGELRESSKELTRNVRLYAASGDERFEKAYQDVLDERAGKIPRFPDRDYLPNEKHELLDLLKDYGLAMDEIGYIETASILSHNLVPLEIESINAVKGKFKDNRGEYTIEGAPDRAHAIALVFGPNYDKYTEPIMRNMDNFAKALKTRLDKKVAAARHDQKIYMIIFSGSLALMLAITLFSIFYNKRTVIEPLVKTRNFSIELAKGQYQDRIHARPNNEIGELRMVLNSMADTITRLNRNQPNAEKSDKNMKKAGVKNAAGGKGGAARN